MSPLSCLLVLGFLLTPVPGFSETMEWPFSVFLDDTLVGSHRFTVKGALEHRQLESIARFDVRFLGIDFYRYEHVSQETWKQDCLEDIQAQTNDNGTTLRVDGKSQVGGFALSVSGKDEMLPACIMTFAYWNPEMLKQSRLLNPQTGELTPVTIRKVGHESLMMSDKEIEVDHFHLSAEKFDIDLWYDLKGHWVALDSLIEGNRKLKYRLVKPA